MSFIRYTIYFAISFTILSIPVNNRPLFGHLHKHTAPYTSRVFIQIADSVKRGIEKGKRIFINSDPGHDHSDVIMATQSSTLDKNLEEVQIPEGEYTDEEKEVLEKVLKKAQY